MMTFLATPRLPSAAQAARSCFPAALFHASRMRVASQGVGRAPSACVGAISSPEVVLTLVDGPLADAVSKAADYAGKSIAPGTVATYKGDWSDFSQLARQQGVDPTVLPVHPVVVAAWLAVLAPAMGGSALRRRVAAIAWHHRSLGHTWQSGHAAIRQTLSGIGREHHRPVRPAAALISTDVKRLIAVCPNDLAGLRDRALFLVGLAGAFRRSELVGIDVAHLRFETESVIVRILHSKTDQAGQGADVALPRMPGHETCPVRALEAWLRRARESAARGPVFLAGLPRPARSRDGCTIGDGALQDPAGAGGRGEAHGRRDRTAVAARVARRDDHRGDAERRAG